MYISKAYSQTVLYYKPYLYNCMYISKAYSIVSKAYSQTSLARLIVTVLNSGK